MQVIAKLRIDIRSKCRFDASCGSGYPVVFHGNRGIRHQQETSFNHLYTFFSNINPSFGRADEGA
jgi:hypothetical protein